MRLAIAGVIFMGFAAIATAQQQPAHGDAENNPEVLDHVYACATITDEHERLACYDAAVGNLHEAQNRGDVVAVDRQQVERVNREAFGFSLPSLPNIFGGHHGDRPAAAPLTEQDMTIASVQRLGTGRAVFTMSNGQVWAQIDDENSRNARQGGEVTVRSAVMASFLMSVKAGGPAIRVRRQS